MGDTPIELAQKVGASGEAVGIDCCAALLEEGARNAKRGGVANVRFSVGDAQDYAFAPTYDLCFSRFGAIFFANPVHELARYEEDGKIVMQSSSWTIIARNPSR